MSDAVAAFGTVITIDDGGGAQTIGELQTIGGPSMSADAIEVTSHQSADGAGDMFREFLAGLKDAGEVTLEGNWIPTDAGQADLLDAFMNGTVCEFVITYTDSSATTCTFDGIVTRFEISGPHDGKLGFSSTVKIDGKPVFA